MVKKISVLALAGLIAFPAMSLAGGSGKGGAANVDDLERKIEELSRQLDELKAQPRDPYNQDLLLVIPVPNCQVFVFASVLPPQTD